MNETTDLSLATFDEIWTELKKRYRSVLLVTETDAGDDQYHTKFSYAGGANAAIGMCEQAKSELMSGGETTDGEGTDDEGDDEVDD